MKRNGYQNVLFGLRAFQQRHVTLRQVLDAVDEWGFDSGESLSALMERRDLIENADTNQIWGMEESAAVDSRPIDSVGPLMDDVSQLTDGAAEKAVYGRYERDANVANTDATASMTGATPIADFRFEIKRRIAIGGLGEVFLAEDKEVHRDIALKCIREQYADNAHFQAKFIQETEITGRLEHPHIMPIYGAGKSVEGRPFYAMRYIEGEDLRTACERFHRDGVKVERNSAPFRRLLVHFVDVCNAITYAHSRHVIHRDIKPSNIMLGKFGETYVVDWGLAKALGDDEEVEDALEIQADAEATRKGSEVGTRGYMSPEQAEGNLDEIGAASDIYSLGGTLYNLMLGRAPILGQTESETYLRNVRTGAFPKPTELNPNLPKPLESICLKALATEPENRYPSAGDLALDVEAWLADEPVSAHVDSSMARIARWGRHHMAWVFAGLAFLTLAFAVLGFSSFSIQRARRMEREQLAINHLYRGIAACDDDRLGRGLLHLDQAMSLATDDTTTKAARQQLHAWQRDLEFRMPQPSRVLAVAISEKDRKENGVDRAGKLLVTFALDGTLTTWDCEKRELVRRTKMPLPGAAKLAKFSTDGSKLVVVTLPSDVAVEASPQSGPDVAKPASVATSEPGEVEVLVWDVVRDAPIGPEIVKSHATLREDRVVAAAWIHDQGNLLFALRSHRLVLYNIYDQSLFIGELNDAALARSQTIDLAVSPDNRLVLSLERGGHWGLFKTKQLLADFADGDGKLKPIGSGEVGEVVEGGVFGSDSDAFWTASRVRGRASSVRRWEIDETDDDEIQATPTDFNVKHNGPIPVLAHCGTTLVTGSNDRYLKWWDVSGARARLIRQERHEGSVGCALLTEAVTLSGADDRTARMWPVQQEWQYVSLAHQPTMLASSAELDLIAIGSDNGDVQFLKVNAETPRNLTFEPWPGLPNPGNKRGRITSVALSPAGDLVLVAAETGEVEIPEVARPDKRPSIVQLWRLAKEEAPQQVGDDLHFTGLVLGLAFHPNGEHFLTGGTDSMLRTWSIGATTEVSSYRCSGWVTSVAADPSNGALAAGCVNNVAVLIVGERQLELEHQAIVDSVAFVANGGSTLLASGSYDDTVELWDMKGIRQTDPLSHESGVVRIRIHPNQPTRLTTLTRQGAIRHWDASRGTTVGPKEIFASRGKDFCVGRAWVAAISVDQRTLFAKSEFDDVPEGLDAVRSVGWKTTVRGQQRLSYDEWMKLFSSDIVE